MHIPDGYLGPPTYGGLWAVMLGVWGWAAKKMKQELPVSQVPSLALASAFSFVAMIFALPLPGGTTAHISGATLIAVLIGPWAAVIAVSVSLMIQALIFGDGGVTALSANCFNIAFISSFAGYGVYRLVAGLGGRFSTRVEEGEGGPVRFSRSAQVIGTGIGAYVGINAAAFLTALELGLQTSISGNSGYFPYPLSVAIPAIMIPHLTIVGGIEAIVAAMVISFLRPGKNGVLGQSKTVVILLGTLFLIFQSTTAPAHDFFIEKKGEDYLVVFGHGKEREEFDVSKIKQVKAFDPQGKEIVVNKEKKERGAALKMAGRPSVIMVSIDNGYWSKTIYGWKELPKRKASRVVEAIHSLFFTKALFSGIIPGTGVGGDALLDIVPMTNPLEMKPGESFPVKIVLRGRPLAGAEIIGSEHTRLGKADKDGIVKVILIKGPNLLTVETREPLRDDPDADALTLTATLTFEVKP
jgi:cobalt/nickel transport system permease protein